MIRLFVALPIPDHIQSALNAMCHGLNNARWVPEENRHLTLFFIGEVENGLADDIDSALRQIEVPPVEISLESLGFFAKKERVHTIYSKAKRTDELVHLQKKVESALVRAGLPPESRKFTPHVTLARLKPVPVFVAEEYCASQHHPEALTFTAQHFTLYSSKLTPQGSIYTPEVSYGVQGVMPPFDGEYLDDIQEGFV